MRSPMDKLPLIPIPILITHKAITSRKRSLAMTITWRIVAEIDTLLGELSDHRQFDVVPVYRGDRKHHKNVPVLLS